jgi:hypothetical protein
MSSTSTAVQQILRSIMSSLLAWLDPIGNSAKAIPTQTQTAADSRAAPDTANVAVRGKVWMVPSPQMVDCLVIVIGNRTDRLQVRNSL